MAYAEARSSGGDVMFMGLRSTSAFDVALLVSGDVPRM